MTTCADGEPAGADRRASGVAAVLLAALAWPGALAAQSQLADQGFGGAPALDEASVGLTDGSFIAAPIPIMNPTLGTGLALGGGYLFTLDAGSDASFVGIGAFRTDNGSTGYALGANLEFGGGRWKLRGVVGDVDLSYDLYPAGAPLPIEQTGALARLGGSYGITDAFSVGLDLGYIESDLGTDAPLLPPGFELDFGISTATADLDFAYDTRDDTIYPTSGINASLRVGWGTVVEGPGRDFTRGLGKAAFYLPLPGQTVVAGQAAACRVSGETPFFLACSLGGSDGFRGYPSTQNIGDSLASLQLALRGHLAWRFGYAVFAGVGSVADEFGGLADDPLLAAGGLGLRFRLSRKYPVDFSMDVAVNREEETTTYVYVGQRF